MLKFYKDYYWKNGVPIGLHSTSSLEDSIAIVSDPYKKHLSIECFKNGFFSHTIYSSILMDFRRLKEENFFIWERQLIEESITFKKNLIRDPIGRAVFFEQMYYEENLCRKCCIESTLGVFLCRHEITYQKLGDLFDGVILYDPNNHPIMEKKYSINSITGEFEQLLEEHWDFAPCL